LTLYTRPGCHLCDEAKAKIAPLLRAHRASLREVNIDGDEILRARYNDEVPVLFLGARKVAKFHVDVEQLERQLSAAGK
jgi:glutaredoxin